MGVLDPTLMTEYSPEIPMLVQPFLIKDYEHFGKVLALPEVRDCEAALAENNITVLGYFYAGFRAMCFTNKEVKNVEDCKGIIIRSPEADIYMNTLKRLGMSPTPMAMPEMYQAMKQGVIEGAEPAAAGMDLYSLYEVCPYILRSNHMFSFNSVVISTELWNSLPEVYKTIISEEVQKAAADEQWKLPRIPTSRSSSSTAARSTSGRTTRSSLTCSLPPGMRPRLRSAATHPSFLRASRPAHDLI